MAALHLNAPNFSILLLNGRVLHININLNSNPLYK
jgi:hypothetical protein